MRAVSLLLLPTAAVVGQPARAKRKEVRRVPAEGVKETGK